MTNTTNAAITLIQTGALDIVEIMNDAYANEDAESMIAAAQLARAAGMKITISRHTTREEVDAETISEMVEHRLLCGGCEIAIRFTETWIRADGTVETGPNDEPENETWIAAAAAA